MNLILLTNCFPYAPPKEQFIKAEIPYLCKVFDKVVIIVSTHTGVCSEDLQRIKYPNLEVQKARRGNRLFEIAIEFFHGAFFTKDFVTDIKECFMNKRMDMIRQSIIYHVCGRLLSRQIVEICNKIQRNDETVIYSYWLDEKAYAAILAKKEINKKGKRAFAVARAHGSYDILSAGQMGGFKPCKKRMNEELDCIYPISDAGKNILCSYGFSAEKMQVCRLGVEDVDVKSQVQYQNQKNTAHKWLIVSCSNIVDVKRIDRIISALSTLKDHEVLWVHFGDGDLREGIEHACRSMPPNIQYIFEGVVSNEKIIDFYIQNRPDLILNTSEAEGIPVSLMEAASCGIPIIATDVGGNSEICIPEINGFLLPSNVSTKQLSETLQRFFLLDENQKSHMRKNSRRVYLDRFCAQTNYEKFAARIGRTVKDEK